MMNKIKSPPFYRERWLAGNIREALSISPVIVLTGARQTGKSTLLKYEMPFRNWRYLSFDRLDVLSLAKKDPAALFSTGEDTVIDEVQKAPEVLTVIKGIVDANRRRRFILSGSANLLLMKQVSESLAGRALYFNMQPFTLREWLRKSAPAWFFGLFSKKMPKPSTFKFLDPGLNVFKGFLPPVLRLKKSRDASLWWEGYVRTYLERDLRDLSQIASLGDFRKIMEILALRTGSILNETDVARDLGMSQPTTHRYINLLETSCLFTKLRPYTRGRSKRVIKAPKSYFLDSGLAACLAGYRDPGSLPAEFAGHLFESMILSHLSTLAGLVRADLYYWRTFGGREREVDFIVEKEGTLVAIETKLADKITYDDIQNIMCFMNDNKNCAAGLVVYRGRELTYLTKNIMAVPWTALC